MTEFHLFDGVAPVSEDAGPGESNIVLGTRFYAEVPGWVTGLRFFKSAANTGTHIGHLWTTGGTLLASVVFAGESSSGWQTAYFPSPVAIAADTIHMVSYIAPNGHYASTGDFFNGNFDRSPLHGVDAGFAPNGTYHYLEGAETSYTVMPNGTFNKTSYFVDPIFSDAAGETTVTVKVRESGAWVERTAVPRVWVSGAWVTVRPKRWNGTAWIEIP